MNKNQLSVLLSSTVVATVLIFWSGLYGPFHFDDTWNILNNASLKLDRLTLEGLLSAADSGTSGPLGRPLAMLSFALDHYRAGGFDPFFFKLTNLIIHLLCGVAVFFLARTLVSRFPSVSQTSAQRIALLTCALWLLAPINLSPVLYVVQRMTSLSALFCFLGMLAYVKGRIRLSDGMSHGWPILLSAFALFLPLGLLSKENAALLPLFCLLIESVFFGFRAPTPRDQKLLKTLFVLLVLLPFLAGLIYLGVTPGRILNGYAIRDFTLMERLLTEARVLLFYLSQIIPPLNSELSIFHDDIVISRSLSEPVTTVISIGVMFGLVVSSLFLIKRYPVYAFSVLFYFAAHLIESTFIALELVHEHRNYVASFSVLLAMSYGVVQLSLRFSSRFILPMFCSALVIWFAGTTFIRAKIWGNENIHAFSEVLNHPQSARSNYQVGRLFASAANSAEPEQKPRFIEQAVFYFGKSAEVSATYTDGLFGLLMLEAIEGHPMSASTWRELNQRLARGPFNHNNYNYLQTLFRCLNAGACKIPLEKIQDLLDSCQQNPLFKGRHKKNVLGQFKRLQR